MTIAVVSDPTYPVPGDSVTLSATGTTGNFQTFSIDAVPDQSTLATGALLDVNSDPTEVWTPDVAGAYTFSVYDFVRYTGIGRYPGDPAGESRDVLVGSASATVYVGDALELSILTTTGHGLTVRIVVLSSTVRTASLTLPTTELARLVTLDSTVLASLAALEGVGVTAIGNELSTDVTDLRAQYERHRIDASHSVTDTVNNITRRAPFSNAGARECLNEIYDKLLVHMRPGTSGTNFHNAADDTKNLPLTGSAKDDASATVLCADLRWRVYDRHRTQHASPASHTGSGDTTNTLSAITPLATVIRDVLDAISNLSGTAPSGEQQGALDAAHRYGFARAA